MCADKLQLSNTFQSRAQQKHAERANQEGNSQLGLGVLQALYPNEASASPSAVLEKLKGYVSQKKTLQEAFGSLNEKEQGELRSKIGASQVDEVLSMTANGDGKQFWQDALSFGVRLKSSDQVGGATAVLCSIAQGGDAVPKEIRDRASQEYDAIVGKGSNSLRGEFLIGQFTKQATDWRVIAPMIAGSAVFSLARTASMGRLTLSEASWATRGFGASLRSTVIGTAFEVPVFALGTRFLSKEAHTTSIGQDLLGATLTLGTLKAFGAAGNTAWKRFHGVGEAGVVSRMAGAANFTQGLFGQGSVFIGLMANHQLEQSLGLRPKVSDSTAVLDTLSSMVSLGVGAHLGHRALGPNFAAFEAEMEYRTRQSAESMSNRPAGDNPTWLNSLTVANQGFGGLVPVTNAPGKLSLGSVRPLLPPKGGNMAMMIGTGEGGGEPPAGKGTGGSNPSEPSRSHLTWLGLGHEKGSTHIRVTEEHLPEAQKLSEASKEKAGDTALSASGAFLKTVLDAKPGEELSEAARTALLGDAFMHFHQHFVGTSDVHAATRGLENQAELVSAYFNAKAEVKFTAAPKSALIEAAKAGKAGLFAQFGGQANEYFGELKGIYDTYPEVRPLIREVGAALVAQANSPEAKAFDFHDEGMNVVAWLEHPEKVPSDAYLASSAVSQPLINLTQLAHYFANLKILGVTPGEFRDLLKGSTGHSQGVMSSVVVSSSATEAEFIANATKTATYLIWQGIRMQQVSPKVTLHPDIVAESVARGDGVPTAMLGLLKLSPETVQSYADKVNKKLPTERKVEVSLKNGPRAAVVSGHPESLHSFLTLLRENAAKGQQGQVPFSDRKLEFQATYFPVSAPFHTKTYMNAMRPLLREDMQRLGIDFEPQQLAKAVYNTFNGLDLRDSTNLLDSLIQQQSILPVVWELATLEAAQDKGVSHILDFGPGEQVGIGAITARNKTGTGVQTILAGSLKAGGAMQDRAAIYDSNPKAVRFAPNWEKDFGPKLVRLSDGTLMVDTKFTRLLGKPPVMAAGMTPTSANETFVAGVINAGFHGELAGGGQHTEAYFRERIAKIMERVPAGEGITTNLLFLNAYLWGFQAPLVEIMGKEGKPMDGVTVAAGVPSPENAKEVLGKFREAGIRHVAFKPGDIASIKDVIAIAKDNPETTVMLQWTGGRGGGHHSFEDMHQPILETYASIRAQKNIILVAGSGLGDAEDSLPYMTGSWSEKYGYPKMPYDGILLGSRLMVAEEAQTAPAVKELIVKTPGIKDEAEWEKSYKGEAGGVVTVDSELGAPIHKIANDGIKLWKEFDDKYFIAKGDKKPADLEAAILKDKNEIIEKLNSQYQKLYFGQNAGGKVVDLPEMTYAEVIHRMMDLMYVSDPDAGKAPRWIDVTYRDRVYDFMARVEDRFHPRGKDTVALLQSSKDIEADPVGMLAKLLEKYPTAQHQLISSQDIDFFFNLCKRPGKPVNFIPVIDKELKIWMKKDGLWQSEDLEAVPGKDVNRVAILQGPLAVRYADKVDEPVADIMGKINQGFIDALKANYPNVDQIPTVEYLGGEPIRKVAGFDSVIEAKGWDESGESHNTYTLSKVASELPPKADWLEYLAGPEYTWLRAFLTTPRVVQGQLKVANPMAELFQPRPGQTVQVVSKSGKLSAIRVYDAAMGDATPALEAHLEGDRIHLTLNHERPASADGPAAIIPLSLEYRYNPKQGYSPVHEVMAGRNQRIKDFYAKLWFGDRPVGDLQVDQTFSASRTITREDINRFRSAVRNQQEAYLDRGQDKLSGPVDMAILAGWEPMIQTIFPQAIDGDIFKLVHLSNGFETLDTRPLQAGDKVDTAMRITEVRNVPGGKRISVEGTLSREGNPWVKLTSQFFIRGQFGDFESTFSRKLEKRVVTLAKAEDIEVLKSKPWFKPHEAVQLKVGDRLVFSVETKDNFKNEKTLSRTATTGIVTRNGISVADVDHLMLNTQGNIVERYLSANGKPIDAAVFFESGGYTLLGNPDTVTAPADNGGYAVASRDFNPIHVSPYVADLAQLPDTITHGMWTSANGRRVVETFVAKNKVERVVDYQASFTGMVKRGDKLSTQLKHVGMRNGRKIIEVETTNQDGVTVLKATAEVTAPSTAYVFTGQGSAEVGMGMDLYDASPVAKEMWDRADRHLKENLGFSLLNIVRNNPKELTISFGGPKGAKIRANLMALTREVALADGSRETAPLFPEINAKSETYTFRHPEGLLFATQFTQPAITLVEMAAYDDMRVRAVVPPEALFAGHSLGEYAGLSTVGEVLPVESVAEVVFLRGMTMQSAVPRDAEGFSPYRMAAVNPSRIGMSEERLKVVVEAIAKHSGKPLELVNYNVADSQYVAAGDAFNVDVLYHAMTKMKADKKKPMDLDAVIPGYIAEVTELRANFGKGDTIVPKGSVSVIPLPGIDVPFHSTVLRDGVPAFRTILEQKVPKNLKLHRLVGRYIPNLIAEPFSMDREYFQKVYDYTKSPVLEHILRNWDTNDSFHPDVAGRKLVIELLAYQFASPVRWIETQNFIFNQATERFVEIGPAPTLKVMAERTLKNSGGKFPPVPGREILSFKSDGDSLYFRGSDASPNGAAPAKAEKAAPAPAKAPDAPKPVAAPLPPAPVAAPAPTGGAPVSDAKVTALEALRVLLGAKLKKGDIQPSDTIKALVGGKSALQNEIFGILQKEFGPGPDNSAELPLSQLAEVMGGAYSGLGKESTAQIDKLLAGKMPGGFGKAQIGAYLSADRQLGEGRIQGVLLHALTMEPSARLGSDTEAKNWLDTVVDAYGAKSGVRIPKGGAAPAAAPMMAMAAGGPAAQPVPDKPVSALEVFRALLAVKLKKAFGEVGPDANVKSLVGGKSALQNEILGELVKEFGNGPDNAAELPLSKLAEIMGGTYSQLGKLSSAAVAKLFATKMPGSFGLAQAKDHLASERLLGPGRVDGALALALTMEPAARLGSDSEAKTWLDSVVDAYASSQGITAPRASQGGGGGMAFAGGGAIDSAALKAFEAKQESLIRDFMRSYAEFLGENPRAGELKAEMEAQLRAQAEAEIATLTAELGEPFIKGIKPMFDSRRMREYEGFWNWARQDILELYHNLDTGKILVDDASVGNTWISLLNRSSDNLVTVAEFHAQKAKTEGKLEIATLFDSLAKELKAQAKQPPVYFDRHTHMAPKLEISANGEIKYSEVPRKSVASAAAYAEEMRKGSDYKVESVDSEAAKAKIASSVAELRNAIDVLRDSGTPEAQIAGMEAMAANLEAKATGKKNMPYLFLRTPPENDGNMHLYDPVATTQYLDAMDKLAQDGTSFAGKTYLAVGAGRNSIAIEVVKNLLAGGATVITTTLFGSRQEADFFKDVYEKHGAKGSRLITLPMNQASMLDTKALVNYIYDGKDGLGLDLDGIIPFAAIPEQGADIGNIDSKSEFAHRMMLTNVIRLMGEVKNQKQSRGIDTRPAHVLLPMSPNHGSFGFDGLYAESKIGLEPLFNKWKSEGWSPYLSLAGAPMGWTRGTGVMAANNVVAQAMEGLGARTFSQAEMAFNLTALLHPDMVQLAQQHPVWADLNGGFSGIRDLNTASGKIRADITGEAGRKKAVATDQQVDSEFQGFKPDVKRQVQPKANLTFAFPKLPSAERRADLQKKLGNLDLNQVVVVTGFGEVAPWGNSRTRWEMESKGQFSLEGAVEMAWTMGLIKYHNGQGKDGKPYTGWVDAKTNDPVPDHRVKELYEETILKHSGIRLIEPALFEGYDPKKKMFLREVQITRDMVPIEVGNKEEADAFKLEHGDKAEVYEKDGQWFAKLKKGAILHIPKALHFNRTVAGQIPTGWDPARYGVPKDIIDQVDPTTLYILVSTIDALISAGITDPYEFYEYVHVSEVGNAQGGGMGGMRAIRRSFRERMLEKPVQGDILQEQLINVMPAWINMLLLSSSGPIKTPVGACATAAESIEIGYMDLKAKKAKIVLVGGYDDFGEEGSYEFANMQATSDSDLEFAKGRDPREMSRPNTKSRAGFMEGQGAGTHILTTAELAIQMGMPIYGIVGLTHTATDKQGRSVPAPGQGVLSFARKKAGEFASPLLDPEYRREQIETEKAGLEQWKIQQQKFFDKKSDEIRFNEGDEKADSYAKQMAAHVQREVDRKIASILGHWGHDYWQGQPDIAPLEGVLNTFGLTIDDVEILYKHDTSTPANDRNESGVVNKEMTHLGRKPGNPLYTVSQKVWTGHLKGGSHSVMFNGLLQSINSGIIPGNPALDNPDPSFIGFEHLVFPNRSIQVNQIEAGLTGSFGFGQAGVQVLVIHPDRVFGAVDDGRFGKYEAKRAARENSVYRHMQEVMSGKRVAMKMKDAAPYAPEHEEQVLLDPTIRAQFDPETGSWVIRPKNAKPVKKDGGDNGGNGGSTPPNSMPPSIPPPDQGNGNGNGRFAAKVGPNGTTRLEVATRELQAGQQSPSTKGQGVDSQLIAELNYDSPEFKDRNFSDGELARIKASDDPKSTMAGIWAAKEAVIKAISNAGNLYPNLWQGAGAPVKEVEIVSNGNGPTVRLKGHADQVAKALSIGEIKVSISHSGDYAIATATAN